jgi:hypothetical protein
MLAAIVAVGLFSARLARQQASLTPLQLFQKMVPVIQHDRCANCHGGVDPIAGTDHEGGAIDTVKSHKDYEPCVKCHTKQPEWKIVENPDHLWYGKTDEQVCAIFSEFAMKAGRSLFLDNHLKQDPLVVAGFIGDAGGPHDPPDKPKQTHDEFIKLAADWYDQGQHACNLLGTITLTESVSAVDSFPAGPIISQKRFDGTRTVVVSLRDGKYHAKITTDYSLTETNAQQLLNPKTGAPCHLTQIRKEKQTGTTSDTASVTIKDTIFYGDTESPQTDYRIDVWLPRETTHRTETTEITNDCGIPIPIPPTTRDSTFTWGRTWFVLEGHVQDPTADARAGSCDRDALVTDINTDHLRENKNLPCLRWKNMGASWYLGLMQRTLPKTLHDGKPIKYHLNANWNLKYTK